MPADFDKISRWYDFYLNQIYFKLLYKKALDFINGQVKSGDKLLDIGCGTGNWLLKLKMSFALSLYGIDDSRGMITKALSKNKEINWQIGRAENLPFSNEEFDFISIIEAFHHFNDQKKALSEARRVLKNKGRFLLVDPALNGPLKIIWQGSKLLPFERNSRHHSYKSMISLIKESGFAIIKAKNKFGNAWILAKKT